MNIDDYIGVGWKMICVCKCKECDHSIADFEEQIAVNKMRTHLMESHPETIKKLNVSVLFGSPYQHFSRSQQV